tara:strand:+ start:25930 stop:26535 length:606 start_codon:yes stop_codon:yes gene_type:complete
MILDALKSIQKPTDLAEKKDLKVTRRDVLQMGTAGLVSMVTPLLAGKTAQAASPKMWQVSFRQAHTGESFSGVYRVGDQYLPDVFERLNYMLRDFRTGEAFPMDPRVIDVLSMVQQGTGKDTPLEILSGYRTPKTNAMLYRVSEGVARNSYHMYGQAIDIRMPGYNTKKLSQVARGLRAGGVGYYPKSHFVHVDTGEIRSW